MNGTSMVCCRPFTCIRLRDPLSGSLGVIDTGSILLQTLMCSTGPSCESTVRHFSIKTLLRFYLIAAGWRTLYAAQKAGQLATTGLYAHVRHPQYSGFVLIMFGFLLQWPTLLTLAMFPVLVWMYSRLSLYEERETEKTFGSDWRAYAARTPRFIPRLRNLRRKEIEEQE